MCRYCHDHGHIAADREAKKRDERESRQTSEQVKWWTSSRQTLTIELDVAKRTVEDGSTPGVDRITNWSIRTHTTQRVQNVLTEQHTDLSSTRPCSGSHIYVRARSANETMAPVRRPAQMCMRASPVRVSTGANWIMAQSRAGVTTLCRSPETKARD